MFRENITPCCVATAVPEVDMATQEQVQPPRVSLRPHAFDLLYQSPTPQKNSERGVVPEKDKLGRASTAAAAASTACPLLSWLLAASSVNNIAEAWILPPRLPCPVPAVLFFFRSPVAAAAAAAMLPPATAVLPAAAAMSVAVAEEAKGARMVSRPSFRTVATSGDPRPNISSRFLRSRLEELLSNGRSYHGMHQGT